MSAIADTWHETKEAGTVKVVITSVCTHDARPFALSADSHIAAALGMGAFGAMP